MLSPTPSRRGPHRRHALAVAVWALVSLVHVAHADAVPVPTALLARRAITAGGFDHFQGQLSRDGRDVYFVANENRTAEIFVQNLERGFPRLLFDDAAEVAQPRLSPDGTRLLYVSYQRNAGGDACVFELRRQRRSCLTREGVAALHVFWFPDGESVGVLTRRNLQDAHELRRYAIDDGEQEGALVLRRFAAAPTVAPDGRWLAYVPLTPREGGARGSLRRVTRGFVLRDLHDETEVVIEPELPGTSTQPVFSRDGRFVYFVQHLDDTNFDGVLDGNDRGVLFRAPFDPRASRPVRPGSYEQITSGRTDCQYPAPADDRLVATCVRGEHLQIYTMPLAGLVPEGWNRERLRAEREASRDPWEQIVLLQRELVLTSDVREQVELTRSLVMLHLALREHESADHQLAALERRAAGDAHVIAWIAVLRELVAHRRAEQRLAHGNLDGAFVAAEQERAHRLDAHFDSPDPSIARLARLVEAEIFLVLGDKAAALSMFDAVSVDDERDVSVIQLWTRLADALLRDLGDRERWMAVHRQLAEHSALSMRDRLHHAQVFVDVLGRGRTPEQEQPLLHAARAGLSEGSPLALLIDVELALARGYEAEHHVGEVGVDMEQVELAIEAAIDEVWARARGFEQHRAVVMTVIERASRHDWGHLVHHFAEEWLRDVRTDPSSRRGQPPTDPSSRRGQPPTDHPERKYAEALYEEVMLERAYVELARGRSPRTLFRRIADDTDSLEAHVGYLEACLREGVGFDELRRDYRARYPAGSPVESFVEAYMVARHLEQVTDVEEHGREVERARALLRPIAEAMPRAVEVHHLYAYLAHRQYHRTGDHDSRRAAHARYYLALDLAPHDPRRRASLLDEVGLLQSEIGNHRIALAHFEERERLPFREPLSELSFRLAKGRSLFHVASYAAAETELERALALVSDHAELARFRPLVVDRAALYHLAAGANERAVELYRELVELTSAETFAPAVRMKARLGLAASAVAAGELHLAHEELERVRVMLDDPTPFRSGERMQHRRAESHFERDDYRPIVTGLLAVARRGDGDVSGAYEALSERHAIYEARYERYERDAYLLELARISQQLAENAYRRGELALSRRHVEAGLRAADEYTERTESELDETTVALVRSAAELRLYGRVPASAFEIDVLARVRDTFRTIARVTDERFAEERFLFPIYLAALETPACGAPRDRER